jgi:GR25 family glycosyltransferase involved in LPS biosynthesis
MNRISELLEEIDFYCVCLVNRQERIESVNEIRRVIPNLQIIEALDGKFMTKDDIEKYTKEGFLIKDRNGTYTDKYITGRPLNVGNVGSFISHRKAIEKISQQSKRFGIVIEDDVVLENNFLENICNIVEHVKNVEFDLINLYVFESQRPMFPKNEVCLRKVPVGLWGLQLYLVEKNKAQKVLNALWPMLGATDEQITRVGLNSYVLTGQELIKGEVIKSYTNTTKTLNDLIKNK